MTAWTMAVAAWCMAFSGFTALSLAMHRHHENSYGRGTSAGARGHWLRVAGAMGLLLSLATCLTLKGPTQGWVLWLGMLTAGALTVVGMLSYAPRRAATLAASANIAAGLAAMRAFLP